jgi:hypothetical protein
MKLHWTIALSIGASSAACSSESVGPPPAPPVNWQSLRAHGVPDAGPSAPTARERAVAERYLAALESPGFGALGAELDDDVQFSFPGADNVRGRTRAVDAHDTLLGAFDGRRVAASRIFRTSSEQTVEWTLTGSQSRDWMGVAATHKAVSIRGLTLLFTKDDGSISDMHVYFDVAAVKAELGVGPKDLLATAPKPQLLTAGAPMAPEVYEQAGTADEKGNVTAARAALDALEGDKLDAYEAAFADNLEVFTSERALPWSGKADLGAYFRAMRRAIGQLDTTVTDGWGVGRFAVIEYTIDGEQRGPLGWIPVQHDKSIRFHIVDIVEIRDAKIARVWRYDDPGEAVALPPPG